MDRSLPGSSIHGIFQAKVLEWGAIAFSAVKPKENQNFILDCKVKVTEGTLVGNKMDNKTLGTMGSLGVGHD